MINSSSGDGHSVKRAAALLCRVFIVVTSAINLFISVSYHTVIKYWKVVDVAVIVSLRAR